MEVKKISWWYWAMTVPLLVAGLAGKPEAFFIAMALTAVQYVHFTLRDGSPIAFPAQVRAAYLGLLLLGQWDPLYFVYWLQLAGTSAVVLVGYCPLARFLSLMPWNRKEPLTFALVWRTIVSPPVRGSVLQGLS